MTDDDDQPGGRVPGRDPERPPRRGPRPQPSPGARARLVSVEINPRHIRLVPGQADTATATILYQGGVVDELILSVTGPAAGWARLSPDALNVYPGTQGQAMIRFAPPRAPFPPAGLVDLTLTVTPASDPAGAVVQQASIEIEPFDSLTAAAQGNATVSGKGEGSLPIKVRNLGNRSTTVDLRATDIGATVTTLSATAVVLDPGAETTVWATIRPQRSKMFGSPQVHPFTVAVSSPHSPPITIDGRFEQLPSFGRVRLGLAAIVGAGLVGIGIVAVLAFNGVKPPLATASPTATLVAGASLTPTPTPTDDPTPPSATDEPTTAAPSTDPPTSPPPSTTAPTATTPPTPGPPTPVPTISATFLKDGAWTLSQIDFPPIVLAGFDPDDIETDGALLFTDGASGLIGQWSLQGAGREITCSANYGAGDTLVTFDVAYDGPFLDPFASSVQQVLCGASRTGGGGSAFTVTSARVPISLLTFELTMTNSTGTTIRWRRSDLRSIPTLPIQTLRPFP